MQMWPPTILALACLAAATPQAAPKPPSPSLDVKIERNNNTILTVTIRNTGPQDVRVLRPGSLLDSRPLRKVRVSYGGKELPFTGMSVYISMSDLDDSAFETLPAGSIYKSSLDIAESHDMSQSGTYGVKAAGTLWATVTDMEGLQTVPFESNALTLDIVAPPARLPPSLTKRGVNDYQGLPSKHLTLHQDAYSACTQRDLRAIMAAVHNCRNFVRRAKSAARCGGQSRMWYYFKSSNFKTRHYVKSALDEMGRICSQTCGEFPKVMCEHRTDQENCDPGTLALITRGETVIRFCPLFFRKPDRSSVRWADDQVSILLHELAHLCGFEHDYAYGKSVVHLAQNESVQNPDSYVGFARDATYLPEGDPACPDYPTRVA